MISTQQELSRFVRDHAARRQPLADYGRYHAALGHAPPQGAVRFALSGDWVEHYAADFTVRAWAGVTLGGLNTLLCESGQFLPLDAPAEMTLGEAVAHNVFGPLRCGYGALRDLLLGLRYTDTQGEEIAVGGRTVKNVAGLDVTRLMVGSLGELGVIHQATLRTYRLPAGTLAVDVTLDDLASIDAWQTDLLVSGAAPAWLALLPATRTLRLGYFGGDTGVNAQRKALETFLASRQGCGIARSVSRSFDDDQADRSAMLWLRYEASPLARLIVPPASTGATCRAILEEFPQSRSVALPAHGVIFLAGASDDSAVRSLLPDPGVLVWHAKPPSLRSPRGPAPAMLLRIKRAMDPINLFNPGRLIPVSGDGS